MSAQAVNPALQLTGNNSLTGLGTFVSYAKDLRTGSADGVAVDASLLEVNGA